MKLAEDRDVTLFDLTVEDLKGIHPQFEDDVLQVRRFAAQNTVKIQKAAKLAPFLGSQRLSHFSSLSWHSYHHKVPAQRQS